MSCASGEDGSFMVYLEGKKLKSDCTDEPKKLVEQLRPLMQNPLKINVLGKVARETVIKGFSMQKMVRELETIYDNILKLKSC